MAWQSIFDNSHWYVQDGEDCVNNGCWNGTQWQCPTYGDTFILDSCDPSIAACAGGEDWTVDYRPTKMRMTYTYPSGMEVGFTLCDSISPTFCNMICDVPAPYTSEEEIPLDFTGCNDIKMLHLEWMYNWDPSAVIQNIEFYDESTPEPETCDFAAMDATIQKLKADMEVLLPSLAGHGLHVLYSDLPLFNEILQLIRTKSTALSSTDEQIVTKLANFFEKYYQK